MPSMFNLTDNRTDLLNWNGHTLVTGGPGSGKTTIALIKAGKFVSDNFLKRAQCILFLSFARATVSRVAEQAMEIIAPKDRDKVEISTYHGFAWRLIQSYATLLNQKPIRLLSPSDAASRLSAFNSKMKSAIDKKVECTKEKHRLFNEEGLLDFDLFASKASELLRGSSKIRRIISDTYPVIILDEFQDTDADQWDMVQLLGKQSLLFALADLEQRIYDFRGADPKRIKMFCEMYSPRVFDFGTENYRSYSTEIVAFGNDILSGTHKHKHYKGVFIEKYPYNPHFPHVTLKGHVLSAVSRMKKSGSETWSIAILVPTKKLMMDVSVFLETNQCFNGNRCMRPISHEVTIDRDGPVLAAELIATLLETEANEKNLFSKILSSLCNYLRGRKADSPTQDDLHLASGIEQCLFDDKIRGKKRKELIDDIKAIVKAKINLQLSGSPEKDWLTVQHIVSKTTSLILRDIVNDSKYIRLLHKGGALRANLGETWRQYNDYRGAVAAVKNALLQDHFVAKSKKIHGVYVMNMHKSKGKQFDEVIVYEGSDQYRERFIRKKADTREWEECIRLFRVAVTRAQNQVTILTPDREPSPILF
jgi:DNA helicase-2/ATP-dependent DNA helicase PcrA